MALDMVGSAAVVFPDQRGFFYSGTLGVLSAAVRGASASVISAEWFAERLNIDRALAQRVRDTYYPATAMQPDVMKGLDATLRDMLEQKRIPPGTTVEQFKPAIDLLGSTSP